eukprot:6178424-Pleurochrysis_carterae.AAC.1
MRARHAHVRAHKQANGNAKAQARASDATNSQRSPPCLLVPSQIRDFQKLSPPLPQTPSLTRTLQASPLPLAS